MVTDNHTLVSKCDIIILAVLPGQAREVILDLAPLFSGENKLLVSNLFAGWTGDDLQCEEHGGFAERPTGSHSFPATDAGLSVLEFRGGGDRHLRVETTPGCVLRWAPVHTVSSSEAGLEKIGQGTCFLFEWRIDDETEIHLRLVPQAPAWADETLDG